MGDDNTSQEPTLREEGSPPATHTTLSLLLHPQKKIPNIYGKLRHITETMGDIRFMQH